MPVLSEAAAVPVLSLDGNGALDRDLLTAMLTALVPKNGVVLVDYIERALDILMLAGRLPSKALDSIPHVPSAAMLARPVRLVQVGANDGGNENDPISSRLAATEGLIQVVMVEPVPHLFKSLDERAKRTVGWEGVTPLWGACCKKGTGTTAPFYSFIWNASEYEHVETRNKGLVRYNTASVKQIGSFNINHLMHLSQSTREDLDKVLQVHAVPCVTLPSIMCRMGWRSVDYFVVDAEGVDDDVIFGAQLNVTRPFIVRLEAQHIEGSHVVKHLEDLGYFVLKFTAHGVAEIMGIWANLKNLPPSLGPVCT